MKYQGHLPLQLAEGRAWHTIGLNTLGAHFLKMSERFIWNQMATSYISESPSHRVSREARSAEGKVNYLASKSFPSFTYMVIVEEQLS